MDGGLIVSEEDFSASSPTDSSDPLHDVDPIITGVAKVLHMFGPGEAGTVQAESKKGVRGDIWDGFPVNLEGGWLGELLHGKAHEFAF